MPRKANPFRDFGFPPRMPRRGGLSAYPRAIRPCSVLSANVGECSRLLTPTGGGVPLAYHPSHFRMSLAGTT